MEETSWLGRNRDRVLWATFILGFALFGFSARQGSVLGTNTGTSVAYFVMAVIGLVIAVGALVGMAVLRKTSPT